MRPGPHRAIDAARESSDLMVVATDAEVSITRERARQHVEKELAHMRRFWWGKLSVDSLKSRQALSAHMLED